MGPFFGVAVPTRVWWAFHLDNITQSLFIHNWGHSMLAQGYHPWLSSGQWFRNPSWMMNICVWMKREHLNSHYRWLWTRSLARGHWLFELTFFNWWNFSKKRNSKFINEVILEGFHWWKWEKNSKFLSDSYNWILVCGHKYKKTG